MNATDYSAIALDLGTTSIKAGLLDQHGVLSNLAIRHAPQIKADGGRYESDAQAYAQTAEQVLNECILQADDCKSLGLCSQRSSFLIWDKATGQPVTPLISWQDTRGAARLEELHAQEKTIRNLSGLPLTPYYFAPKLRVVLQENSGWLSRLERGELYVGMLDTFLVWRWTGGRHFVTDASMAARTLLMDIGQQQWSPQLCDLFGISTRILPKITSSTGMDIDLDNGLFLQASVGDQSAALVASVREGQPEALVNLGTGCFVVRYLPDEKSTLNGYLRTLVYQDCLKLVHFAIEGTLNSIAVSFSQYPVSECKVEELATDDIFCLAEPSGLGAPYFRGDIGIRYSKSVEHLSRRRTAALLLEAVIFRVVRILEEFHQEAALERVYLSGGLSALSCLQQGIAQCAPFEIYHLTQGESSLQGAALLAAGMLPSYRRESVKVAKTTDDNALRNKYQRWKVWMDELLLQQN
jgi:glycerol kinase